MLPRSTTTVMAAALVLSFGVLNSCNQVANIGFKSADATDTSFSGVQALQLGQDGNYLLRWDYPRSVPDGSGLSFQIYQTRWSALPADLTSQLVDPAPGGTPSLAGTKIGSATKDLAPVKSGALLDTVKSVNTYMLREDIELGYYYAFQVRMLGPESIPADTNNRILVYSTANNPLNFDGVTALLESVQGAMSLVWTAPSLPAAVEGTGDNKSQDVTYEVYMTSVRDTWDSLTKANDDATLKASDIPADHVRVGGDVVLDEAKLPVNTSAPIAVLRNTTVFHITRPLSTGLVYLFQVIAKGPGGQVGFNKRVVAYDPGADNTNSKGDVVVRAMNGNASRLVFKDASNTNYIAFKAPSVLSAPTTFVLPPTDGLAGQVLVTNGSGSLGWMYGGLPSGAAGGDLAGSYPYPLLAPVGTAGIYTKVTTDAKGRVISGTTLIPSDLPPLSISALTSGTLAVVNGGTGVASFTNNGVVVGSATQLSSTAAGVQNNVLTVNASGAPVFGTVNLASANAVANTLNIANGGTGLSAAPSNGQLLIGNGTGYSLGNLTAGTGITIQNTAGAVTLSTTVDASTKMTKAGDTMTGPLNLPLNGLVAGVSQLVLANGNVGIGTAAPAAKLDVSGGGRFKDQIALEIVPFGISSGNTGEVRFDELAPNGTNYVGFKAPDALAGNKIWVLPAGDGSLGQVLKTDGSGNLGWVTDGGGTVTNVSGTAPISVAIGTSTPVISITQANISTNGYLSSTDWNTFNGKQAAGNYITTLTGDVTASGFSGGTVTATLASVGVAGTSTKVTYDAKGRVLAGTTLSPSDIPPLSTAQITSGTLGVANGGTGVSSLPSGAVLLGNGTGTVQSVAPGTSGNILTSNGSTWQSSSNATLSTVTVSTLDVAGQVKITGGTPGPNKVLTSDATGLATWAGAVNSLLVGAGLNSTGTTGVVTLSVNTGTTANKIVQLDSNAKLPAVDGSALTNLSLSTMTGDSGSGGVKGAVPAPASGDAAAGKFLKADGTWATPTATVDWGSPGAIGGTAANSGAFTTLTASGNIGIGTASPEAPLDFRSASNDGQVNVLNLLRENMPSSSYNYFKLGKNLSDKNTADIFYYHHGTDGNGTGLDENSLNFGFYGTGPRLTVQAGGNVGVGKSQPVNKLDVAGSGSFSGWVGIGTTSGPSYSAMTIHPDSNVNLEFSRGTFDSNAFGILSHDDGVGAIPIEIFALRTTILGGNVGIGTTQPDKELEVVGDIHATGDVTASNFPQQSDARLKTDIQNLADSLAKVLAIRGVSYKWIDAEKYGDGTQFGVIAQELEKIVPEVVTTGADGIKRVKYSELIPLIIEALKSEKAIKDGEIAQLRSEAAALRVRADRAEAQAAELKAALCSKFVDLPMCVP